MKILLLDNYDSFTFNLVHYIEQFNDVQLTVFRNDEIRIEEVAAFDRIVVSPGPGLPSEAGLMMEIIKKHHQSKPILGVCLGMQAIAEFFGARLSNLDDVMHGLQEPTEICNPDYYLFKNISSPFLSGRYHSWGIKVKDISECLEVTATWQEWVMALQHRDFPICGVQFHPESVMTPEGLRMIGNWIEKEF